MLLADDKSCSYKKERKKCQSQLQMTTNFNISFFIYMESKNLYRGSYMSAHVSLHLLNELGKRDKL